MPDELHRLTALELASRVQRGELSCVELTRAYLDRIAAHDPRYGAFVEVRPERALACAARLDAERARAPHAPRSPLWGLPTGIKDLQLTRGFYARMGSRAFRYVWSPVDDVTSATVRRAGMVIVGKLATSELAIMPVVETSLHPPARNPWHREHTAGGSSGGSGAALAAGMLPIAPASDGAGSIRIPAAFCGLVGHKPTRGLVPNPHARFERLGISTIGPHARSVDDAAALLDVLSGRDARAPESFLAAVRRPREDTRPARIRVTTRSPVVATDPLVARAVERVTAALADAGHAIEEGGHLEGTIEQFLPLFQYLAANTPVPFERVLQPTTRWLRERGRAVTYVSACARRDDFAGRVAQWFGEDTTAWVTPTVAQLPPRVGAFGALGGEQAFYAAAPLGAFTAAFNTSGHPAASVPVWVEGAALPIGVQIVGRMGDDAGVLALAREVMHALGTPHAPIAPGH